MNAPQLAPRDPPAPDRFETASEQARRAAQANVGAACFTILVSELRLALRNRADVAQPLIFFIVVGSLFPLGLGAGTTRLAALAPGLLWVCALLSVLLSLPQIYARDALNGTLEQLVLSPYPLAALCGGKIMAHWLLTGLPLAVLAPLMGTAFGLDWDTSALLAGTLLLGTPILSMIGAIGAALTLGARAGSVLVALLVLPLYVPVLVFGTGTVEAWRAGVGIGGPLLLLGAGILFGLVLAPLATAAAVRIAIE